MKTYILKRQHLVWNSLSSDSRTAYSCITFEPTEIQPSQWNLPWTLHFNCTTHSWHSHSPLPSSNFFFFHSSDHLLTHYIIYLLVFIVYLTALKCKVSKIRHFSFIHGCKVGLEQCPAHSSIHVGYIFTEWWMNALTVVYALTVMVNRKTKTSSTRNFPFSRKTLSTGFAISFSRLIQISQLFLPTLTISSYCFVYHPLCLMFLFLRSVF